MRAQPLRRWTTIVLLPVLVLAGCGESTGPADAQPGTVRVAATVGGVPLRSTTATAVLTGAGNFTISTGGNDTGTSIALNLFSIGKPGTYPLGATPSLIGGNGIVAKPGRSFSTPQTGEAGSVTITAISLTHIAGTFDFVASREVFPLDGGPDFVQVSGGSFDVDVTGTGTLVIPDNVGSTATGTIGGTPFMATQITVAEVPSNGALRLVLRQASRVLTVNVPDFTGPGTYALGGTTARIAQLDAPVGSFNSTWGGTIASTSGTLTVTAVTTARIRGVLTATLVPTFAPLNTPPSVIALPFDIGIP